MDARVRKLGIVLQDREAAAALVAAGFDLPRKIEAADDKDLEAVKGIGKAKREKIRARVPKVKRGD